jgi:putative nucleotidyltransferase with HDIG domain
MTFREKTALIVCLMLCSLSGAVFLVSSVASSGDSSDHTLAYAIVSVTAVGLVFGVAIILVLDRILRTRLSRISSRLQTTRDSTAFSQRVALTGKDEFSRLASEIDTALESLEKAHGRLAESEARQRATLQMIPDLLFLMKEDGSISAISDGEANGVRSPSADSVPPAEGSHGSQSGGGNGRTSPLVKTLAEAIARQGKDHASQALTRRQMQSFEVELPSNGSRSCWETRMVACGEGQVLAMARDITDRRRTEESVAKAKDALEMQVQERTAELDRVNEVLKKEISLRLQEEEVLRKSFKKVEVLLENTIEAMSLIVERKDPYTAGHQRRVARLACAIGREMGLGADQIQAIRVAAMLHDLGKIFVPAEILNKPGRLTASELDLIKTHPSTAHEILKTIDFSCPVADIVAQHHERLDGSGYPAGLGGDEILPEARILGVADVVEAMSSSRPYRPALGLDEAVREIVKNKGILYDPEVVRACVRLLTEKKFSLVE